MWGMRLGCGVVGGGDRLIGGQSEEERLDRAWGGGLSQVWLSVAITGSSITSIVMGHMKGAGAGSSSADMIGCAGPPRQGYATHVRAQGSTCEGATGRASRRAPAAGGGGDRLVLRSLLVANCAWFRRGWD